MLFWASLLFILGIIWLILYALKSRAKSLSSSKRGDVSFRKKGNDSEEGTILCVVQRRPRDKTESRKKMFNKNILHPGEPGREKVQGLCPICNQPFLHPDELYRCPKCKLVYHLFHIKERKKCLCKTPWIICDKVGVMNILSSLLSEKETDSTEAAEWEAARRRVEFLTRSKE